LSLLPTETHGFTADEAMLEFDVAENPFREELPVKPFVIEKDGRMAVPTGPGLGIEINEEVIEKYAVR
jgi:D-galactarolactone cycloisomerase